MAKNDADKKTVELPVVKVELTNLHEILSNGNKIYRIAENRSTQRTLKSQKLVEDSNTKKKMKSIEKFNVLQPLYLAPAALAVEQGMGVMDMDGNDVTEGLENAYVILDGQHRYTALMVMVDKETVADSELAKVNCLVYRSTENIISILIEMNTTAINWEDKDYGKAVATRHPENELAQYINRELNENGVPISVVSLKLMGNKDSIKASTLATAIDDIKNLSGNLNRAMQIDNAIAQTKFEKDFKKKRYIYNAIISLTSYSSDLSLEKVLEQFKALTEDECAMIQTSPTDSKESELMKLIKGKLQPDNADEAA